MVDPNAVVTLPGAALVVPEGEFVRRRIDGAEGIGVAEPEDLAERRPGAGLEQGVVGPGGGIVNVVVGRDHVVRSEEHTSELQSLMRISYAVFCLKKKNRAQIYIT